MSDVQIDVNKVVESLANQVSLQAQRIAVLEATIHSLKLANERLKNTDTIGEK